MFPSWQSCSHAGFTSRVARLPSPPSSIGAEDSIVQGSCEHVRIGNGHRPVDGVAGDHGEALDDRRIGAVEIAAKGHPGLAVEVGGLHDQRVALPPANRVPLPEANGVGEVLTPVHVDDAHRVLLGRDVDVVLGIGEPLRKRVEASDVVELAVADRILVGVDIHPPPVPLRQRPTAGTG